MNLNCIALNAIRFHREVRPPHRYFKILPFPFKTPFAEKNIEALILNIFPSTRLFHMFTVMNYNHRIILVKIQTLCR